jgi:hypothetical protein
MKFLIIDSHKGSLKEPQNLHWLNAKQIKDFLIELGHEVDLVWSYPTVNEEIKSGYDRIIFNHASHYSYVDYAWLQASPDAKLFHITNEYNLGEPRALWMALKNGRRYEVIANHSPDISKIVQKYVDSWHFTNLNALIFNPILPNKQKKDCVYYGSFRKDRETSFRKYLKGNVVISTHQKNRDKFQSIGVNGPFIDRINWSKDGLMDYKTSLYIEDEITHENYNCLANRFYECLNYNVLPLFDASCKNTISLSGYDVPDYFIINNESSVKELTENTPVSYQCYLQRWKEKAAREKRNILTNIASIVS